MSDNKTKITVHAAGDPGSWVRNVQENPLVALTALALLEEYFHTGPSARLTQETEKYLRDNKRLPRMIDCEACGCTHLPGFGYCVL